MTPLPKKKHAKSRTRKRKAAISLELPNLAKCPNCQNLKLPHRACPNCGYVRPKETKTKSEHEEKDRSQA
ncbi:50S ribosomal protein L32 [Candidatus Curtissbacteria bacterium]|nr:50S ribosomal protein L32 [Candidatus Curtissbacteria bacterium]